MTKSTELKNKKIVNMIMKSFTIEGSLTVAASEFKSCASEIINSDDSGKYYGKTVNGFDAYLSILIIANPNTDI